MSPKQVAAAKKMEVRRGFVAKMYCRERATYQQIVDRLALSPKNGGLNMRVSTVTICDDIKALRIQWHQEMMANIGEVRARELADLDEMEQQAVEQYQLDGDRRTSWFNSRLTVKDKRAKILGLDAPTKHEHTGKDGGPIALTLSLVDMILQEASINHDPLPHKVLIAGPADGTPAVTVEVASVPNTDTQP